MGRRYSGDISGRFWFAVQSSDDGEFFGAREGSPDHIHYYADNEEIAKRGIEKCLAELGEYKQKLDDFFKDINGYNDEMIAKAFDIDMPKVKHLLEWYARLELGEKILKCIQAQGDCYFEAEL